MLANSLNWLGVPLVLDQWFKHILLVIYFTEFVLGLFGNGIVNKIRHYMTGSSPRCTLQYHFLVCIDNNLFIVGIGPILNEELEFIDQSDCSDPKYVYS